MYGTFISYLSDLKPSVFHIFLHHNADPDAICAAEAFGFLFQQIDTQHQYVIYSDDINSTATTIMERMNVTVLSDTPQLDNAKKNIILTVDTANLSQLGKYASWVESQDLDLLVVDHHDTSELAADARASIVVTNTASTCVIADKTIQKAGITPTGRIATLILSGHMYDSRRMLYGTTAEVFTRFAELIELGGDFELANELLQNEMGHGEIIARLKAYQRLKYTTVNGFIVVTSKVGAFEASAARSFIGTGADIAMILAPKGKELRGSARARNHLINIGDIMSTLATEFGGTGGGHAAAAGMNITPAPSKSVQREIMKRFVKLVEIELTRETN